MRVLEHSEAFFAPCGGGTATRSMRRLALPTLYRFSAGARVRLRCPLSARDSGCATSDRVARSHPSILLDFFFRALAKEYYIDQQYTDRGASYNIIHVYLRIC